MSGRGLFLFAKPVGDQRHQSLDRFRRLLAGGLLPAVARLIAACMIVWKGIHMTQVASIKFIDVDSGDEAWIGVRAVGKVTGLALSLMKNGDMEVFMQVSELDQLIEGLQKARAVVTGRPT
jgi:hypothetical protein